MTKNKVHIIGGGIIGLCSAYYLQQAGLDVVVIDKTDLTKGCSHGNAGLIVPSHFVPLAAPGVIAKGIAWMFSAKSPFYIRPRLNLDLINWLWQFYRSSNAKKANEAMPFLRDFNQLSKSLYHEMTEQLNQQIAYEEKGLIMLYRTPKGGKEEMELAERANALGITTQNLTGAELSKLESGTKLSAIGGVYYPGDAHLYPNELMLSLKRELSNTGVEFRGNCKIEQLSYDKNGISALITNQGRIEVQQLVLATGTWTASLARKLGLKLLIQDGKGYSITLKNPKERPHLPAILVEDKVAVTPMGQDLRIGGTLEISGLKPSINPQRLKAIVEAMPRYYPAIQPELPAKEEVWLGFRPCTPDGLPYLGRSLDIPNLIIATGHAMMGLSLGAASGKIVSELVQDKETSISLKLCQPERHQK